MNHMKRIATEILGLEWDEVKGESEEFGITEFKRFNPHKLTKDGLADKNSVFSLAELTALLAGHVQIKKLPKKWKPNCGEDYFVPCLDDPYLFCGTRWNTELVDGDEIDNHRYNNNLIYCTKEEAVEESKRILKLRLEGKE